jgi:pimeloyl-ACP methyl ester carboxylesterase
VAALLSELTAPWELAQLLASPVYYGVGVPAGDGRPVLVLPGFGGGDAYLVPLVGWLRRLGYRAYTAGIVNTGSPATGRRLAARLQEITTVTGQSVSVIGHSLGGVYAWALARLFPVSVRQAIGLAAPLAAFAGDAAPPREAVAPYRGIVSCDDRIVPPVSSILPHVPLQFVRGSHLGLVWNAEVYRLLAYSLAEASAC